eukprot:3680734-Rhodomonas_salina.1
MRKRRVDAGSAIAGAASSGEPVSESVTVIHLSPNILLSIEWDTLAVALLERPSDARPSTVA